MSEYIEREAAMKVLNSEAVFCVKNFKDGEARGWNGAYRSIRELPAADVVPVVHGTWEERDDGWGGTYYHCSACGEDWCIIEGTPDENYWNFCPNCGAKMDGDS
ncbi:MAG: hypothetical protein IJX67_10880 [Oscillospiraceae bacterium]|nr:hypothetical protein [Oscillospiraceae bacterium]